MRYTNGMRTNASFQLDIQGAQELLTDMVMPLVKSSADAIASRAGGMAGSISSRPPTFTVSTRVGTIRRGVRAIATVTANGPDAHAEYVGHTALTKSIDAGRV